MEDSFPLKMLRDMDAVSNSAIGEKLHVERSTVWRLREALRRGVLPDLALVIAVYWALGYDKEQQDTIARLYAIAKKATPLRRETTEHRASVKAEQDRSPHPSTHERLRV